jgi:hypothetical protein
MPPAVDVMWTGLTVCLRSPPTTRVTKALGDRRAIV